MDRTPLSSSQTPDPRWPSKSRWSVKPIPPFSRIDSADPLPTGGNSGASSPTKSPVIPQSSSLATSECQVEMSMKNTVSAVVLESTTGKHLDASGNSKGELIPFNPATETVAPPSRQGPFPQSSIQFPSLGARTKKQNLSTASITHTPLARSTVDNSESANGKNEDVSRAVLFPESSKVESQENCPRTPIVSATETVATTSVSTLPSLQGAWAHPLKILSSAPLRSVGNGAAGFSAPELWPSLSQKGKAIKHKNNEVPTYQSVVQQQADRKEDDLRFPWAARMNPASRNLFRASEPEYLDDGTPKVTIPPHVLLQGLENQKDYILGQFFRCSPPPGGLIYAVFNKLWGRNCKITIRKLGESNYLFHIPDEATRNWVLQRGLWHVDDCLMFVAPWTPEATLAIPEIKTIPVWVTLKKIPNILYSISGISHIASGLGAPMATHKPRLDPIHMGEAKILVEVELSKAFPPKIAASDTNGFISMVDVDYAWLPTKCTRCGQLGHKIKRCLLSEPVIGSEERILVRSDANSASEPTKSVPAIAPQSSNLVTSTSNEVTPSLILSLPTKDPILIVTDSPIAQPEKASIVCPIVHPAENKVDPIECLFPETTPSSPATIHYTCVNVQKEGKQAELLGSNQFASLGSLEEEEESSDSDKESDSTDHMTHLGKRILRERPVKPSTKAKEMTSQVRGGGRGSRGRGMRGGRG